MRACKKRATGDSNSDLQYGWMMSRLWSMGDKQGVQVIGSVQ